MTAAAPQRRSTATRRYRLAALLAGLGLLASLTWGAALLLRAVDEPRNYARAAVPGTVSILVPAGTLRIVYYEGSGHPTPADIQLALTDGSGRTLPTTPYRRDLRYDAPGKPGTVGVAIASFTTDAAGTVTIRTTASPDPDARLAVGPDLGRRVATGLLGPAILALGTAATAAVMALAVSAPPKGAAQ